MDESALTLRFFDFPVNRRKQPAHAMMASSSLEGPSHMNPEQLYDRYRELQQYVGWTEDDAGRVHSVAPLLEPFLAPLIEDFYEEIDRHPNAKKVLTGGNEQVQRLKGTLRQWLRDLLHGPYNAEYVARRSRVGWRHVEIGLDQVYTNVAVSRLRRGLLLALETVFQDHATEGLAVRRSLNTLLDLDLAIIEDAYQAEYMARQQRADRLAAIGQVAGGIAHELRNPLNVVKTSVYFLLTARSATPEKRAEHLQRIERHVQVADGVITALSNFAKMPLPELKPVAIRPWVQESLELNPLPQAIHVNIDCPSNMPAGLADPDQVRIVLGNLLRNAREAMPQGGTLNVAARANDGFVEIDVADTGTGIHPDQLAKIMEPLYSTKARGLGLGLAIARSILEKNHGTLRVRSEVGKGSQFTIRLMAAPAPEDPA
jgi:signal transduction histidine kinase